MTIKLNLIVAVCDNFGIGKNNQLPWRLKTEMAYFTKMTTDTVDPTKKNAVIMGRKTWDSIPPKFKPLTNRINIVLSRSDLDLSMFKDSFSCKSLDAAINKLQDNKLYESIWIIGGSQIYKEAMDSKHFHRLFMTKILKNFDCDTFFPPLGDNLQRITLPHVPSEIQEENNTQFIYNVYENNQFKD